MPPRSKVEQARKQYFLQSQRAVVIVRQVHAGPRSSSSLKQFIAVVTTVVDLDVARERFGQVLK